MAIAPQTEPTELPHEWVDCIHCGWAFDKKKYPGHGNRYPDCRMKMAGI